MTLFKGTISDFLTSSPFDAAARQTHPGQAHFAGSGPAGKTCRECIFYGHTKGGYYASRGKWRGLILPAPCKKYRQMTQETGPNVPDSAMACKYFEENTAPPSKYAKQP